MWSSSSRRITRIAALGATVLLSAGGARADGEVTLSEERQKICAKAENRFAKLYPDYRTEPGVVLVKLYKYNFCPANLTVKAGTTVRWINIDKRTSHSVWVKQAGIAESERFFPEEIWEHTFTESGAYPYICGPHGEQENMLGFVKVVK